MKDYTKYNPTDHDAPCWFDNAEASAWLSGAITGANEMRTMIILFLRQHATARSVADYIEANIKES